MRGHVGVGVLAAALLGCVDRLEGVSAELVVSPLELDFAPTLVGGASSAVLTVSNGSLATVNATITVNEPFEAPGELVLGPGSKVLQLHFRPVAVGVVTGELRLEADGLVRTVALRGEGVEAARCPAPASCRVQSLDPASNSCVESVAPDGADCTDRCLQNARCRGGVCMGAHVACDDGNACTADACDRDTGCTHAEVQCAAGADPCLAALCDPARGCVTAPVADGTSCGAADCSTALVCLGGRCERRRVPDGAACGAVSPCQHRGVCSQQRCEQPAPQPLAESWSVLLPDDSVFAGVTDDLGNLYWVECGQGSCSLVSRSAAGFVRYRTPLTRQPTSGPPPGSAGLKYLWRDGRVAVAWLGSLEVFAGATGTLLYWTAASSQQTVLALAADAHGQLHSLLEISGVTQSWRLETREAASGALLRTLDLPSVQGGYIVGNPRPGLVLDEDDNLYLVVERLVGGLDGGGLLLSLSHTGALRLATHFDWGFAGSEPALVREGPLAVAGGALMLERGSTLSTASGSVVGNRTDGRWLRVGLRSAAVQFQLGKAGECVTANDVCDAYDPALEPLWLWSGSLVPPHTHDGRAWLLGYDRQVSTPLLLADGSALIASYGVYSGLPSLDAHNATGGFGFSCELPTHAGLSTIIWGGAASLHAGRWTVLTREQRSIGPPVLRLVSFVLPGVSPAPTGWVTPRGDPGGSGRPR